MIEYLLIYLGAINVITYIYYVADKRKAQRGKWRIPESKLLLLAAAGGAPAALIAMHLYRHKTRHWKFRLAIPLLTLLWVIATIYLMTS